MRLAIMISFALVGLAWPGHADDALQKVAVWTHVGYILPEERAEAQRSQLLAELPGLTQVDEFWTPTEQDVAVADRAFRDVIKAGTRDPASVINGLSKNPDPANPDTIAYQRRELQLVLDHYDDYQRQYLGLVIKGAKLVFCNYSHGPKFDASLGYIYMQKVFVPGGTVQFLQCRFEPIRKVCTNVSLIGSWQADK